MPQSPTEKIDLICAAAREKDKDLLDKLVEDNLCIDIYDGSETAIQRLALEGDTESVEFLIKYFDADVNRSALGAAEGGHQQLLDSMLAQDASLNFAVYGAACGFQIDLMERLLSEGVNLNWATGGAAYAASRNAKTTGKSSFDQIALMENLILRGGSLQWCLTAAARGGCQSLVDDIINRTKPKVGSMLMALCKAHSDLVEHLIERSLQLGQDIKKVKQYTLAGAALKGNQNSVEQLLNQVDLKSMDVVAATAAHGGHYDLMKNLNHQIHNKDT